MEIHQITIVSDGVDSWLSNSSVDQIPSDEIKVNANPNPWQVLQKLSGCHKGMKFICEGLEWEVAVENCAEPEPKDPETLSIWWQKISLICLSRSHKGTILSTVIE